MPLPYNGNNKTFAKRLRREATKQENHLWYDFLKTYPVQFRRQLMIDNFIVDFYCHGACNYIDQVVKERTRGT